MDLLETALDLGSGQGGGLGNRSWNRVRLAQSGWGVKAELKTKPERSFFLCQKPRAATDFRQVAKVSTVMTRTGFQA